jgi:SCY1-like protein 1
MRDQFPPARIAGILALSATQNFYTLRDTATKVMPALCHLTMDPEKSVREQAFKALKGFVSKIEKVSEDPTLATQMEADLNAASSEASTALAASWAGWAVSSLTSKFYRSKTPTSSVTSEKSINSPSLSENKDKNAADAFKSPLSKSVSQESVEGNVWGNIADGDTNPSKAADDWGDGEGWDDFDADTENVAEERTSERKSSLNTKSNKNGNAGWDTEGGAWDSLSEKSSDRRSSTPQAFEEGVHVVKQRPAMEKKKEPGTANSTSQARPKAARKGPMKLGAQKIS